MTTVKSQFTTPGAVTLAPDENLTTSLWQHERERPDHRILAHRQGEAFVPVTYAEMATRVRRLAAGLIALGLEKGTRVALFLPTRLEFTLLDYAIWAAGCATVTIYETSSDEQVHWIVTDSGAEVLFCADKELAALFSEAMAGVESPPRLFVVDEGGLDELAALGEGVTDETVMERAASVAQDDLATLVYTSGTTGQPKGCALTVKNFVSTVRNAMVLLPTVLNMEASTLLFLPLAHSFARIVQVGSIITGSQIAFSTGIPQLMEELQMVKPTWLFSVPRVFEKVYNTSSQRAHSDGKGRIFDLAAKVAGDYSRGRSNGKLGIGTRALHAVFDRLVYSKIRHALGGRVRHCVSGGAPLGERLGHFYAGIGVDVLEGYGLTETSAAFTFNPPDAIKIGTVGRPLPGSSVGIAEDDEVLLKGDGVFSGYWNNPEATAESVETDGWFHSGDVGSLDADGYLSITGRKKELIVTAGGKNVAPAVLEDRMRSHSIVGQVVVVGDNRPFIGALVTIDPDEYPRWADANGVTTPLPDELTNPALVAAVQEAVDDANHAVSRAEAIRNFRILPVDFTIEGGELTPTLKVRRQIVHERYAAEIEALYDR